MSKLTNATGAYEKDRGRQLTTGEALAFGWAWRSAEMNLPFGPTAVPEIPNRHREWAAYQEARIDGPEPLEALAFGFAWAAAETALLINAQDGGVASPVCQSPSEARGDPANSASTSPPEDRP